MLVLIEAVSGEDCTQAFPSKQTRASQSDRTTRLYFGAGEGGTLPVAIKDPGQDRAWATGVESLHRKRASHGAAL
jgi:hypothetical protein